MRLTRSVDPLLVWSCVPTHSFSLAHVVWLHLHKKVAKVTLKLASPFHNHTSVLRLEFFILYCTIFAPILFLSCVKRSLVSLVETTNVSCDALDQRRHAA